MLHRVPKSQPTYICQRTALYPGSNNMVNGQRQCLTDTGLLKKRNTRGRERTQEGRLWRERTWSLKVATWLPKESTKVEEGSPGFTNYSTGGSAGTNLLWLVSQEQTRQPLSLYRGHQTTIDPRLIWKTCISRQREFLNIIGENYNQLKYGHNNT